MSNSVNTAADIRHALAHCTGTENYYKHRLGNCVYTDGAKTFAEMAEAYWLLDILATEVVPYQAKQPFIHAKLNVTDDAKAVITADDGNGNQFWSKDISWTDCPCGEWRFYVIDRVILVTSEY
jgi:hypothetical protein